MACYKTAVRVGRTLTHFCYNIGFKNSTLFQCACYLGEQYKDNTNPIWLCAIKHPTECRNCTQLRGICSTYTYPKHLPATSVGLCVISHTHPHLVLSFYLISANLLPFHNNHKRQFSLAYFHKPTSSVFQCQTPYLQ